MAPLDRPLTHIAIPCQVVKLMDELGLLEKLKSDIVPFASDMYMRHNPEKDGRLTFEEFRGFYNEAVEDAKGRRPAAKPRNLSPTKLNDSPTKRSASGSCGRSVKCEDWSGRQGRRVK